MDDTPRKAAARQGFSVVYRGMSLLSRVAPEAQARAAVDGVEKQDRTLYFCPSPLLGYGIPELLRKVGDKSAVLCAEADEALFAFSKQEMAAYIPAALTQTAAPGENPFTRLAFVRCESAAGVCHAAQAIWGNRVFRRVVVVRLTGGWRLNSELYRRVEQGLERELALDWGNALTLIKLGRRYSRNLIRNLPLLCRAADAGSVSLGSAPVLVLGAGPSLDGLLERLRGFFGGGLLRPETRPFRLLCADTALPCLAARGIRPDMVVALESQHWNLRDFTAASGAARGVTVAMDLSALPTTVGVLAGKTLLFATPWTSLTIFSRMSGRGILPLTLPPLGSVGLTAVKLALSLGTGPVVSGGLDFSFTLDLYHARAACDHGEKLRCKTRLNSLFCPEAAFRKGAVNAAAKNGDSVKSDVSLKRYRGLFEREFAPDAAAGRLSDIEGSGLPLGVPVLGMETAFALLAGNGNTAFPVPVDASGSGGKTVDTKEVRAFVGEEAAYLASLRDMLTGNVPADTAETDRLLGFCDYLWAHFPDCAAREGERPLASDIAFLKRVRVEIDLFLKLFSLAKRELAGGVE